MPLRFPILVELFGCAQFLWLGIAGAEIAANSILPDAADLNITTLQREKPNLVLVHVPWNFGHTIEKVALSNGHPYDIGHYLDSCCIPDAYNLTKIMNAWKPGGEVWGATFSKLHEHSSVGCSFYLTPPKLWPEYIAKMYFKDKKRFAMLRDPYERLVAIFRGDIGEHYGGLYKEFSNRCDVDGAVNNMLDEFEFGNRFAHNCVFLQQSEYFDGPYGAQIAVDNTEFPASMNALAKLHNYSWQIEQNDIICVHGCRQIWAADLLPSTRKRIQKLYKRDFELRCKLFGYCNYENISCIKQVTNMCPSYVPGARVSKTESNAQYFAGAIRTVMEATLEFDSDDHFTPSHSDKEDATSTPEPQFAETPSDILFGHRTAVIGDDANITYVPEE